jgi:redox-sensitive bicupin YhaK (pirin superfamily)
MMKRRTFIHSTLSTLASLPFAHWVFGKPSKISNKMNKQIVKITDLSFTPDFPGLKGVNMMARNFPIEPYLVFTEFYMERPVFGPHPHAGVSVMTYMLPDSKGSFINRDSEGDFSYIEPGGMHIMQAGKGMMHDEFPKRKGIETHGFQIWINHSDKNRLVNPKSMHASASDIPEIITQDHKVRIVHGEYLGKSLNYKMVTDVLLLHVFLQPSKKIIIDAKEMAFVYGLKGNGFSENEPIKAQTLVNYSLKGDKVEISASENGFEFMLGSGTPHNEPITYGGPFVMTTPEQMNDAQRRYAKGEMGKLEPYNG